MREIKFRVWDGAKMITFRNPLKPLIGVKTKGVTFGDPIDGHDYDWSTEKFVEIPDGQLMQYTGLKDRHGVEIYEGDLVQCVYTQGEMAGHPLIEEPRVVEWRESWIDPFDPEMGWQQDRVQVIGNIYEHPELLSNN